MNTLLQYLFIKHRYRHANKAVVFGYWIFVFPFLESDPSILQKGEEGLENENLSDAVFDQLLLCLKEEWME